MKNNSPTPPRSPAAVDAPAKRFPVLPVALGLGGLLLLFRLREASAEELPPEGAVNTQWGFPTTSRPGATSNAMVSGARLVVSPDGSLVQSGSRVQPVASEPSAVGEQIALRAIQGVGTQAATSLVSTGARALTRSVSPTPTVPQEDLLAIARGPVPREDLLTLAGSSSQAASEGGGVGAGQLVSSVPVTPVAQAARSVLFPPAPSGPAPVPLVPRITPVGGLEEVASVPTAEILREGSVASVQLASEAIAAAGEVGTLGIEGAEALIAAYPDLLAGVAPAEIAGMTGSEFGSALASGAFTGGTASPLLTAGILALPAVAFAIGQAISSAEAARREEKIRTATATAQAYNFDPDRLSALLESPGTFPEHTTALAIAMERRPPSPQQVVGWALRAQDLAARVKIIQAAMVARGVDFSFDDLPSALLYQLGELGVPIINFKASFGRGTRDIVTGGPADIREAVLQRFIQEHPTQVEQITRSQQQISGVQAHASPEPSGAPVVSYAPPAYGPAPPQPEAPPGYVWVPADASMPGGEQTLIQAPLPEYGR
jgi:hypothetical protein